MTGVLRDFAIGPANWSAVGKFSFLHDVSAAAAPDQFGTDTVAGIEPVHSPTLNGWVVNSNRRAEPIGELGRIRPAIRWARIDENILHSTTFEHPCEMCFPDCVDDIAIVIVAGEIQFPASNQEAVEIHDRWKVGRATFRCEDRLHRIGSHHGWCCFHENEVPAQETNCQ